MCRATIEIGLVTRKFHGDEIPYDFILFAIFETGEQASLLPEKRYEFADFTELKEPFTPSRFKATYRIARCRQNDRRRGKSTWK